MAQRQKLAREASNDPLLLVLIVGKGNGGVELPWAGLPTAEDDVIEVYRRGMGRLIRQLQLIAAGRVMLPDVDHPVLRLVVVVEKPIGYFWRQSGCGRLRRRTARHEKDQHCETAET